MSPLFALLPTVVAIAVFVGTLRLDPKRRAGSGRALPPAWPGALLAMAFATMAAPGAAKDLQLSEVDREVPQTAPDKQELESLAKAVAEKTKDRAARFALVRALMRARQFDAALREAKAWRTIDAYNLVVVRLLGDIYAETGDNERAQRAYSAVVELLPGDAQAHRALAAVLKQTGHLEAAFERLEAALSLAETDHRIEFELADVAQRLGKQDEAKALLNHIVASPRAAQQLKLPARQRLAQIVGSELRTARAEGKKDKAVELEDDIRALAVPGGVENDIKVYLSWDTDRTDVDLWVTTPAGETISYKKKKGQFGGQLFHDVTDGYGPESFSAKSSATGSYAIEVHFYGTQRRAFAEARGEVIVVLNEGRPMERRHVLPYRLFAVGQRVKVATVDVR